MHNLEREKREEIHEERTTKTLFRVFFKNRPNGNSWTAGPKSKTQILT